MNELVLKNRLADTGVFVTGGHFVYATGEHGSIFIDKNRLYVHPVLQKEVHSRLANKLMRTKVDVVVGVATGGVCLAHNVAYHISIATKKEVESIYAEKISGQRNFKYRSSFSEVLLGKKVIIVDDGLQTGETIGKLIELTKFYGGIIVCVGVLFNKNGFDAGYFDVPNLVEVFKVDYKRNTWSAAKCRLCVMNIPINLKLGQGMNFLGLIHD